MHKPIIPDSRIHRCGAPWLTRALCAISVIVLVWAFCGAPPAMAIKAKDSSTAKDLELLTFVNPRLRVTETPTNANAIRDRVANIHAIDSFRTSHGPAWKVMLDESRGVPSLIDGGAIAFVPGRANGLQAKAFGASCRNARCIPVEALESAARTFLADNREVFRFLPDDLRLDPSGAVAVGDSVNLVRFQWYYQGVPVERGSVFFRINGGNLIQVATERIGQIHLDTTPTLTAEEAWETLAELLGYDPRPDAKFVDSGSLLIVPMRPEHVPPGAYHGAVGLGIDYALTYHLAFVIPGQIETWEAVVDAHTGEILRFVDMNRYGRIHGGAYPGDNHTGEADRPLAFADTGLSSPDDYADAGGLFPGDTATTTLKGKYTWITDYCGSINATTSTGDVNLGVSPAGGTDCDVPNGNTAGPGNTIAARTQFYQLTNINIKARTYMPTNSWLNNDHMNVNTNQSSYCNASSGGGTLNFYQSTADCWNLGELPGVALHEWGHSMDDFDGSGGDSPPLETRADWTAALQLHDSCIGRGTFKSGTCSGYGDTCLSCTGIREIDYTQLESNTPWTAANHGTFWSCSGGSYFGPCGLEDHCESGISSQALWELVHTDLAGSPYNMDPATAWMLIDRLFYSSMPTLGDMYTCSLPSSNGCNGTSLYNSLRAIDDDGDGTANGTPHASAIYAALARHNIACGSAGDAANQDQSTCPSLSIGTPSVASGSNSATLTWSAVTNATRYFVFRNDVGCDAGYTKVGTVNAPLTSFTDTTVVNDIQYSYRIQAAAASDSCTSALSSCVTVTPQPCAGALSMDRGTYNCSDTISFNLVDSDLAGYGSQAITVWSSTEATPETVVLSESPAGSGIFTGTVGTTVVTTQGDGLLGVADGDTITARYTDASYCGPAQDVDTQAAADCIGPQISGVQTTNVSGNSADVSWTTDQASDSQVTYDTAFPPAAGSSQDPALVTSHALKLTSLAECTTYYYSVSSADAAANTTIDDNGGSYYSFTTVKNTEPTYTATDTPVTIVDNTTVSSTVTVPDNKPVIDINVQLNITHTWDGDLEISLLGPNSTEIMLVDNRGSSGDNFVDTVLDDEATTPISSGTAPFTGSFQPEVALSAFDGISAIGDWTLKVRDTASADTGFIGSWSLTFVFPGEACTGGSAGTISLDKAVYTCSDSATITVDDDDLTGAGSIGIDLLSDTETTPEVVTLTESPAGSGHFTGTFATTAAAASHGDSAISLSDGDTLTARYIDADDGQGGTDVTVTDTATADCAGPVITGVQTSNVTTDSADISWATDEDGDSLVVYDTVTPPTASSASDATMTTAHDVPLTGLTPNTTYYYYVESIDALGNTGQDDNGGAYYSFTTADSTGTVYTSADTPTAIPDNSTTGVSSTIRLKNRDVVVDVDVILNITHTYDADVDVVLTGPNRVSVVLTADNGGSGDNYTATVLDDEAATSITSGTAPFTGSFQPEEALSVFDGIQAKGAWTLNVVDDASGDTGTLESWSLRLTYAP